MSERFDLITVGRANMDLYSQQVGAAFEDVRGFDAMVGGSPTNIAIAAARLGKRAIAFTAVGDDRVGDFVVRYLRDENVSTDFIPRIAGKLTSLALLGVQPPDHFPLSFYREDPADIYLSTEHAARLPLDDTVALQLSGDAFSREPGAATSRWLADEAHGRGPATFLDLDLRPMNWKQPSDYGEAMRWVMSRVDVVIGTEEEFYGALSPAAGAGSQRADLTEAQLGSVGDLLAGFAERHGEATIVLKQGPSGATVFDGGDEIVVPGFPSEVLNTVGAGDAFAGALISRRVEGAAWADAARYANACGAIVVTRHGCASALPTPDEVEAFVADRGGW